jgi:hypothetical protein
MALAFLAGCASTTSTAIGPTATGDERGGKVAYAETMSAANNSVRTHCEQFGRKGYIMQMNLSPQGGGTMVFECH